MRKLTVVLIVLLAIAHTASSQKLELSTESNLSSSDTALVADIQKELKRLGYDLGSENGVAGPRTHKALRLAQGEHDLGKHEFPSEVLLTILRSRKK